MKEMKRLLVINQYYAPDLASTGQIAAEICKNLVKRGFEVHVVTGQPSYLTFSPEAPKKEVLDGVYVHRVYLGGVRGREKKWVRLLGYLWFLWGAWRLSRSLAETYGYDVVVTFHNPPFVSLLGAYLARKYKLSYVYIMHDIHPDFVFQGGWRLPQWLVRIWNALNKYVFQNATVIIVLGEGMRRNLLEDKGVPPKKVKVIPLWARPELPLLDKEKGTLLRRELGISSEDLLFLHAGNIGLKESLGPILDAAATLQNKPIHFVFVGSGVNREHLLARVQQQRLEKVHVLPFQPEDRFVQLIAAADACFVTLKHGFEKISVPSRAYTFLSAGRPLITIMVPDADIARLVVETGCGWNVTNGDELVQLIKSFIYDREMLQQRGRRAREVYEQRFRREIILEQYARVIQEVIQKIQ